MLKQIKFNKKLPSKTKLQNKQNLSPHHLQTRRYNRLFTVSKDIQIKAQQTLQQVSDLQTQMATIKIRQIATEEVSPWDELIPQKNTVFVSIQPSYKRKAIIPTKYAISQPLKQKVKETEQFKLPKYVSQKKHVFYYQEKNPQMRLLQKSVSYMKIKTQQIQFNQFRNGLQNNNNQNLQSIKNQIMINIQKESIPASISQKYPSFSKVKPLLHKIHNKNKMKNIKVINYSTINPLPRQLYNRFIKTISQSKTKF